MGIYILSSKQVLYSRISSCGKPVKSPILSDILFFQSGLYSLYLHPILSKKKSTYNVFCSFPANFHKGPCDAA